MRAIRTIVIGPQSDMLTEILNSVLATKLPLAVVDRMTSARDAEALNADLQVDLVLVCEDAPLPGGDFDRLCGAVAPAQLVVVADKGRSVRSYLTDPGLEAVVGIIRAGYANRGGLGQQGAAHG